MEVVDKWTGYRASALQRALRLTNERFAARLGTAVRTIANWNADPNRVITSELQSALDTLLYQSPEDAKTRFALILSGTGVSPHQAVPSRSARNQPVVDPAVEQRLSTDRRVGEALAWLNQAAAWAPGVAHQTLAEALTRTDFRAIQARGFARQRITQAQVARGLKSYYGKAERVRLYEARVGSSRVQTSILTQPGWLDLGVRLRTDRGMEFATGGSPPITLTGTHAATAAVQRLAESLTADLPVGAGRMYRLLDIHLGPNKELTGTFGLADFIAYSLTMDLLESELIDALVAGTTIHQGALPLRDNYLPDVAAVLSLRNRLCGGGVLALTAIARPGSGRRSAPDYLLLVQERSGRVLNAARRLAVIPKAFHEPLSDYREDVRLAATLEREMEEELFGRTDVDSAYGDQRHADPMHPSRLSEPMRWLVEHSEPEHWRMECTGFGLNLVSGNFEFAGLIAMPGR